MLGMTNDGRELESDCDSTMQGELFEVKPHKMTPRSGEVL